MSAGVTVGDKVAITVGGGVLVDDGVGIPPIVGRGVEVAWLARMVAGVADWGRLD